jgi:hypothetical protein
MTDINDANEKKLYVLTRTRLENRDPRHPYGERDTIQEYLQMRQDLPAIWVRKIGQATLYSEPDARKWHLFATSDKEKMEPYVNPCADGHELYLDSENCGLDEAHHDQAQRSTKMYIGLVVYCKKCGMSVDIDLEHKLEDSIWDAIDMDRTAST